MSVLFIFSFVQEEELEGQKQEQVVLLKELEEQKAKLEQMLLEAQQEREHLKAAVTQEAPVNQPEVPACDQEVTSVAPARVSKIFSVLLLIVFIELN